MAEVTARQLTRYVDMVTPDEPIGRAVQIMHLAGSPSVPVGENGSLLGVVSEASLFAAVGEAALSELSAPRSGHLSPPMVRVRDVMDSCPHVVPDHLGLEDLAQVFARTPASALPVVDELGYYQGMITRTDVASAYYRSARPRSIGGLATPLGVFLTTGMVTAGAGNFALMLTGATMVLVMGAARALVFVLAFLIDTLRGTRWSDILLSPYVAGMRGDTEVLVSHFLALAEVLGFLLLLRLLPLTGIHAAEHQTVHAIERGKPLDLTIVRTMPRPHPRCGTNLVAFLLLMQMLTQWIPVTQSWVRKAFPDSALISLLTAEDPLTVFAIAALITFFSWRLLGMKLQYYFTTKPATDKQLLNGIAAGKQLLEKFQDHIGERPTLLQRIWNMGFPQVVAGGAITYLMGRGLLTLWERLVSVG